MFEYFTQADAAHVRYTVGQTKYVFWAWKGEYLGWGDGAEGATYANPISILGIQWYQRAPQGSNLPTIDVSLAVSGSTLGSFNPKVAQDWTGIYDPRQVLGRVSSVSKLGVRGLARPAWTSAGRFQAIASWGRTWL